ncbi:MAG: hypothetical protein DMD42_01545 [Gemmatimonadetes bacterium]|nr:MAG: hypothetical protein DMD42_01545 [Gemmatimonadota bacterium]
MAPYVRPSAYKGYMLLRGSVHTTVVVLAASGALWLAAPPAWGQSDHRRDGFWFDGGLGHGTMSVSCDSVCGGGPRTGGTTAFLQLGAAVSQQVRIGGAVHVWWRSGQPDFTSSAVATERLSTLGAVLDYYPAPTSGFFLGCGVGVSNYHSHSGDAAADASGWGFTVDAGYDIAVGSKVSLTPQLTYAYGGIGAVNVTGAHASSLTGWKQNVIDLGLGLTLR